jgi:bifunctional non-homologous end joining protein LigD
MRPILRGHLDKDCPSESFPNKADGPSTTAKEMGDYVWLRPEAVAEIKFAEWTTGSVLRHPEFVTLRDDKTPKEVMREIP